MKKFLYKHKGFTLIELLVVVVIIGILATLATVVLRQARSKAADARKLADIKSISTALEMYKNDEGDYPPDLNTKWGQPLVGPTSKTTYFNKLPNQPTALAYGSTCQGTNAIYVYQYYSSPSSYSLYYCLDNKTENCPAGPKVARPGLVLDCNNVTSTPCMPSCNNKTCGSDGCGGSCGTCAGSLKCNDTGSAASCVVCMADGDCPVAGQHCTAGNCVPCTTNSHCSMCNKCDLTNGSPTKNQCLGQNAGEVDASGYCIASGCITGKCTASRQCETLNSFQSCNTNGFCIANGTCCAPETCASKGYTCGSFSSTNCPGVTVNCPSCTGGLSCVNNQCCTPSTNTCASLNKCTGTVAKGCGLPDEVCTASTCSGATPVCNSGTGQCVQCMTDTDCPTKCTKCSASKTCVAETASEDTKNECPNSGCMSGNCSGTAGSCGYATSGTDPYNYCATTGCLTGNCNGSGSCDAYSDTSQHNCSAGQNCYGGGCCDIQGSCGGSSGKCPGQVGTCGVTCSTACSSCCKSNNYCGTNVQVNTTWSRCGEIGCKYLNDPNYYSNYINLCNNLAGCNYPNFQFDYSRSCSTNYAWVYCMSPVPIYACQ